MHNHRQILRQVGTAFGIRRPRWSTFVWWLPIKDWLYTVTCSYTYVYSVILLCISCLLTYYLCTLTKIGETSNVIATLVKRPLCLCQHSPLKVWVMKWISHERARTPQQTNSQRPKVSTQLSVAPCSHDQAIEANLVVYNTALSACGTGMAWQKALQLFEDDAGCIFPAVWEVMWA